MRADIPSAWSPSKDAEGQLALSQLLAAAYCGHDSQKPVWGFAVEIERLKSLSAQVPDWDGPTRMLWLGSRLVKRSNFLRQTWSESWPPDRRKVGQPVLTILYITPQGINSSCPPPRQELAVRPRPPTALHRLHQQ
jgi:hypothetical protein